MMFKDVLIQRRANGRKGVPVVGMAPKILIKTTESQACSGQTGLGGK